MRCRAPRKARRMRCAFLMPFRHDAVSFAAPDDATPPPPLRLMPGCHDVTLMPPILTTLPPLRRRFSLIFHYFRLFHYFFMRCHAAAAGFTFAHDERLFSMIAAAAATPLPRQRRHYAFTLIRYADTLSPDADAAMILMLPYYGFHAFRYFPPPRRHCDDDAFRFAITIFRHDAFR
jgi:hypothetical protein